MSTSHKSPLSAGRGERWVTVQLVLSVAILLAPILLNTNAMRFPAELVALSRPLGLVLGLVGIGLLVVSARDLGSNLTALPHPKDDASLVQSGVYGLVRHPIYSAIVLGALGWALFSGNWVALLLSVGLAIFFDRKAALEERWLMEKFADYAQYRQRVRKLIPFIY